MGDGSTTLGIAVRVGVFVLVAAGACSLAATPAAAGTASPSEHEYDATELLREDSVTTSGTVTLTPEGSAQEGDRIRIEIDEDRSAFGIAAASDETGTEIGIALNTSPEAIEIELTDLGGDGRLDGAEIAVGIDLTATDAVASDAREFDSTPIATVTRDDTDAGLVGTDAIAVSVTGSAEFKFDADSIEAEPTDFFPIRKFDIFTLGFADRSVWVSDGDTINISVNQDAIKSGDENKISVGDVWEEEVQHKNITGVNISTSDDANVLDGHTDQITVTINTVDGKTKLVSDEAISIGIQLKLESDSMKSAADRYRNTDLFTVDVEGENNAELTDNDDIATESPVRFDIYPGEANTKGFELGEIESNEEFGASETRRLAIDGLEDRYGNEIPRAKLDIALEGAVEQRSYGGVWTATNGSGGMTVGPGEEIDAPVGRFDLSVEVLDVPGPATQSDNTGAAVTETAADVAVYPDNVTVSTTAQYDDFDVDENATIEVAVDLGVADDDIDRVDLLLRRERGNGSVTVEAGGTPTPTDLWTESGYAGDDRLGRANAWAIERNLTAADFEGGVRRYVLDADAAARYEISAEVMPRESVLVPDADEIGTSLAGDPGGDNRNATEIVATGPIDAVGSVAVRGDREFVGVETDEGSDVELTLDGFVDANGNAVTNTDEAVPVRIGGTEAGLVTPTGGGPSTVAVDPTAIDAESVEVGTELDVTVGLANGSQHNGTGLTAVHRAIERPDGAWRAESITQPATLYVDAEGRRDLVQWDPDAGTYVGIAANASGDVLESGRIDHEDLHRGFYAYTGNGTLRIGFEYATDAGDALGTEEVELGSGWHLASSNYDVSAHRNRSLDADLNWAEYGFGDGEDAFAVWNGNRTERIHDRTEGVDIDGSTESIGHGEAYWIEVDNRTEPLARVVSSPIFSETDGVQG